MAIGNTVGTMPVGAGPVGGVFPGADFVGPQVINITPPPGSADAPPKPVIQFDVIDYEDQLTASSVKARVNGVSVFDNGQPQQFFSLWTGTVEVIPFGLRVTMQAPEFQPAGSTVNVNVTARDNAGNLAKKAWSFSVVQAGQIATHRVVGDNCLDLTFTIGIRVNGQLFNPSNYALAIRLGRAREVYAKTVESPSNVPDAVVLSVHVCTRDFFSRNGRYSLKVAGVLDEYGRALDTNPVSIDISEAEPE